MGAGAAQAEDADREAPALTIPILDSSFDRFAPRQDGHSALRSVVTNASNDFSQSRQTYSNSGISPSVTPVSVFFRVPP
jgi:hypothetical protein